MFKRVTKKLKKRDEEEELGLDEEAKEILGMHDTDSDESESDSDSDNESADGAKGELDEEEDDHPSDEDVEDEDDGSQSSDDGEPPLSTADAIKDPVYTISLENDIRGCIVCPGKLLKNSKVVELHTISAAHKRRFKKFLDLTSELHDLPEDPREVVAKISDQPTTKPNEDEAELSKRAAKRKLKMEVLKKKRASQKAMKAKAKKKREAQTSAKSADGSANTQHSETHPQPAKAGDGKAKAGEPKSKKKRKSNEGPETLLTERDTTEARPEKKRKLDGAVAPERKQKGAPKKATEESVKQPTPHLTHETKQKQKRDIVKPVDGLKHNGNEKLKKRRPSSTQISPIADTEGKLSSKPREKPSKPKPPSQDTAKPVKSRQRRTPFLGKNKSTRYFEEDGGQKDGTNGRARAKGGGQGQQATSSRRRERRQSGSGGSVLKIFD
ncbi:hypothetical protein BD410DRAFT_895903 [Rickenella mellea]|uniref:Uncharacterized protein n=1 Tax=Rickenella mellea TaxID=50990 RepID=A0A4Y7QEI6_9AGAM|nr:hypothetical protein BD410DRAFT_895903 [Rickenella mellea]